MKEHPLYPNVFVGDDQSIWVRITETPVGGGYTQVRVPKRGQGQVLTTRKHRLLCEFYHGPAPFPGAVVRHLNGNPSDDRAENLAWGSQADNMQDAVRHGTATVGVKNARAKLTEDAVREIRRRKEAGESNVVLAAEFGVSPTTVSCIVHRTVYASVV